MTSDAAAGHSPAQLGLVSTACLSWAGCVNGRPGVPFLAHLVLPTLRRAVIVSSCQHMGPLRDPPKNPPRPSASGSQPDWFGRLQGKGGMRSRWRSRTLHDPTEEKSASHILQIDAKL
jgi:hypothetical protein